MLRLQRTSAPATIANDKNHKSEETDLKPHKNALKAGSSGWRYMMSGHGLSGLSIRDSNPTFAFWTKQKISVHMGMHSGSSLKNVKKDLMKIAGAYVPTLARV
jgi:hypothetical protein